MTAPESTPTGRDGVAEVLATHRYRDVSGDYEVTPYYKHFGCSCGWEQSIAGMSGWRSWVAAYEAHVAEQIAPLIAERVRAAREGAWDEAQTADIEAHTCCHNTYTIPANPYREAAKGRVSP